MPDYYMNPAGSDSNSGTSPLSPFQHFTAVTGVMPQAVGNSVYLADGVYDDGLDLVHHAQLSVYGNQQDASKVIVTGGSRGVPFTCEDHAIFTVNGVTLAGPGVGIKSRQYGIVDVTNVRAKGAGGGIIFCASEDSRQNLLGPLWLDGNIIGGFFANADGKSTIVLQGIVNISTPLTAAAFVRGVQGSLVLTGGLVIQNPGNFYGAQCILNNSEIVLPSNGLLPGASASNVIQNSVINGVLHP